MENGGSILVENRGTILAAILVGIFLFSFLITFNYIFLPLVVLKYFGSDSIILVDALMVGTLFIVILCIIFDLDYFRTINLKNEFLYLILVYFFFGTISLLIFNFIDIRKQFCVNFFDFLGAQITIFGIIVTITLILVQLTNDKYSQRFGDFFKMMWEWRIYAGINITSIILSVMLSIGINCKALQNFLIPLNIFLIIFNIVIIFPFIWNILTFIRPDNIVHFLAHKLKNIPRGFRCDILLQLFYDLMRFGLKEKDYIIMQAVCNNLKIVDENKIGDYYPEFRQKFQKTKGKIQKKLKNDCY
jgi:hypothetical protein